MSTPSKDRPKEIGGVNLEEAYGFLDTLRDSGITNMYGSPAYLRDEFDCPKQESFEIFNLWTKDFSLP